MRPIGRPRRGRARLPPRRLGRRRPPRRVVDATASRRCRARRRRGGRRRLGGRDLAGRVGPGVRGLAPGVRPGYGGRRGWPAGPVSAAPPALRRPVVALGTISYGVYLFHWPVFMLVDEFVVRVGVTVALAAVSFRFLERPIRVGGLPRPALAGVAACTAVALVVAVVPLETTPSWVQSADAATLVPVDSVVELRAATTATTSTTSTSTTTPAPASTTTLAPTTTTTVDPYAVPACRPVGLRDRCASRSPATPRPWRRAVACRHGRRAIRTSPRSRAAGSPVRLLARRPQRRRRSHRGSGGVRRPRRGPTAGDTPQPAARCRRRRSPSATSKTGSGTTQRARSPSPTPGSPSA